MLAQILSKIHWRLYSIGNCLTSMSFRGLGLITNQMITRVNNSWKNCRTDTFQQKNEKTENSSRPLLFYRFFLFIVKVFFFSLFILSLSLTIEHNLAVTPHDMVSWHWTLLMMLYCYHVMMLYCYHVMMLYVILLSVDGSELETEDGETRPTGEARPGPGLWSQRPPKSRTRKYQVTSTILCSAD